MSQKERLSSLGRLSTVIAHEVRNPLMIIKGSLHALRQPDVSRAAMREAVADIDEEVERLNRIVNEVLDFAQADPLRARAGRSERALPRIGRGVGGLGPRRAGAPGARSRAPPVTTDAERLRIALVNMLVNARHAVNDSAVGSRQSAVASRPSAVGSRRIRATSTSVTLSTRAQDGRVTIVIADRGAGIEPAHLPHVFDPYFTTKRGGTGLGLAIAKNIVEGLGGTIGVNSAPGVGTEIRISLPAGVSG